MINLIPVEEKKKNNRVLWLRLATVIFINLSGIMLVASTSVMPAYFFSLSEKKVAVVRLDIQKDLSGLKIDQSAIETATFLQKKLGLIEERQREKFLVSDEVINRIVAKKMTDIKITQFLYELGTDGSRNITVKGNALTRERLLLFKRLLEEDPAIKSVELPVSVLAQSNDIQFSLKIKPTN